MKKMLQATHTADGLLFKIGVHGKLFMWISDAWVLSSRLPSEIKKMKELSSPDAHDEWRMMQDVPSVMEDIPQFLPSEGEIV